MKNVLSDIISYFGCKIKMVQFSTRNRAYKLVAQMTGLADMWGAIGADVGSGIYTLISAYPLGVLIGCVVFFNMLTFIVTSADSEAFFVSMIISKGNLEPTTTMRIVWGIALGLSVIILTLSGGLQALQTVSIVAALPFSLVMIAMAVAFTKSVIKGPAVKLQSALTDKAVV